MHNQYIKESKHIGRLWLVITILLVSCSCVSVCILLTRGFPSIFLLSLSTSSSSLPLSFNSTISLSLGLLYHPVGSLRQSFIHSSSPSPSLPFLIKEQKHWGRFPRKTSLLSSKTEAAHKPLSHTHTGKAHEKCMDAWIAALYCTLQSTYSMTYFICSTGDQERTDGGLL